ncbi:MAG: putative transport system, rane protein [Gemmatimonadetes bacterium]|nr:putative transport system, rane protein [Gemmatimonadota bacterium]
MTFSLPDIPFIRRTLVLARAEVLHVVRDRATLAQLLVIPLVQLLVLSNATTFAIHETPIWVVDRDASSVSRGLVDRLTSSGLFVLNGSSPNESAANDAMLRGRATVVLTIPSDFARELGRNRTGAVHLDVNAEKGSAAGVVQSYAAQIIGAYARELELASRPRAATVRAIPAGDVAPARGMGHVEMVTRSWFNPTLDYKHYMVPGILVALITMIGTLITAQNIARERELGTIEQLNVTPITRAEFITAKLLPFWVLGLLDLALGLVVGHLVFGVPMRGSLLLLFASAGVYLIVALSIGLWISTVVETQQQAMFVSFFLLMIYLLMGGLFTPVDSMPRWVQLLSELNPIRHFGSIIRAILLKGAGLTEIAKPLGLLSLYAVVIMTLAVSRYRKRSV